MTNASKPPRFSVHAAIATYLGEDGVEVKNNRRYQPTRTPCPVYIVSEDYFTATKTDRKPKGSDDNHYGLWVWHRVEAQMPYGWVIWKHVTPPEF